VLTFHKTGLFPSYRRKHSNLTSRSQLLFPYTVVKATISEPTELLRRHNLLVLLSTLPHMAVTIYKAYFCSNEVMPEAFVRVGNCMLGHMRGARVGLVT
jgi:hypothetical protein